MSLLQRSGNKSVGTTSTAVIKRKLMGKGTRKENHAMVWKVLVRDGGAGAMLACIKRGCNLCVFVYR